MKTLPLTDSALPSVKTTAWPRTCSLLLLKFLTVYTPLALLVFTCITYGQNGSTRQAKCTTRSHDAGFTGNADFYGLGIRTGLYLQWLSSIIANTFLKTEWTRSMAGAYAASTLALFIALLLLILKHDCVFTVEIIVMLHFLWGGWYQVMLPYMARWRLLFQNQNSYRTSRLQGLNILLTLLNYSLTAVSAWFWIRMASVGQADFVATPGKGTSFFFFVEQVGGHRGGLRAISTILAILTIWNATTPISSLILSLIDTDRHEVLCGIIALLSPCGVLAVLSACLQIFVTFLVEKVGLAFATSLNRRRQWKDYTDEWYTSKSLSDSANLLLGFLFFTYTVVAIELTLYWNSMTNINEVESTGQIVPLIVGLTLLVSTVWKISDADDPITWQTAVQQSDSTWKCSCDVLPDDGSVYRVGRIGRYVIERRYSSSNNVLWKWLTVAYRVGMEAVLHLVDAAGTL